VRVAQARCLIFVGASEVRRRVARAVGPSCLARTGAMVDVLGHSLIAGGRRSSDAGLGVGIVEEERQDLSALAV
jgi:hypothetical protein